MTGRVAFRGMAVRLLTAAFIVLGIGWAIPSCAEVADDLVVQFAGCGAVWKGPVCTPSSSKPLTLWIADAEAVDAVITVDGERQSAAATRVSGGMRYTLTVPPEARRLVVTNRRGLELVRWTLAFRREPPVLALEEAITLRSKGRPRDGITRLREAQAEAEPATQGRLLSMLARLHFDDDEPEQGFALLRRSMAHHRRNGRLHDVIWDGNMLANKLGRVRGAYHEARAVLDGLTPELALFHEGQAIVAYTRGFIYRDTGDYRNALKHLSAAVVLASRLGQTSFARSVTQSHAVALVEMGRGAEAKKALQKLRSERDASPQFETPVAAAARLSANHCWVRLLADEASQLPPCPVSGMDTVELATTVLHCGEAVALLLQADHYSDEQRANLMVNNALAALHVGNMLRARAEITAATELLPNPPAYIEEWLQDVRGRVQLCDQQPARALEAYQKLDAWAQRHDSVPARWRATVGRGRALEGLGSSDEAVDVYRQAEGLLARLSIEVPLGKGRGSFLADRQLSARLLVDLLVRLGRPAEAFAVARRSRQRLLMSLWRSLQLSEVSEAVRQQRERAIESYRGARADIARRSEDVTDLPKEGHDAQLAAVASGMAKARVALEEALAALPQALALADAALGMPAAGEVMLGYHPTADGQWLGFAADGDEVVVRRIVRPNAAAPSALSVALLAPFEEMVAGAQRIVILPYGDLPAWLSHAGDSPRLEMHALPWPPASGEPLVTHAPVVYALDIPVATGGRGEVASPAPQDVLVVADPADKFRHARRDGQALGTTMAELAGWQPTLLQGADATRGAVAGALEGADFFHFSGHSDARGLDGWHSALGLAAGDQLALTDVLALQTVPRQVVLSSCEAIGETGKAGGQRLGLAQAFVIRGAAYAIATVGKVSDHDASIMTRALYRHLSSDGFVDAAAALRAAQEDVRKAHSNVDWASYRVMTP